MSVSLSSLRERALVADELPRHDGLMFIDTTGEAEADGPLADYFDKQRASWGFLPNFAAAFAPRPDVAAAWDTLNGAIRNGMDRRRYEIATIAAARTLRSTYCTVAHSMFLRDACGDDDTMRAIALAPDGSTLDDADRAVYRFAAKVAADASSVDQADVDALRAVGLSDADVADVVYAAAARSFFTRVLDGLGAELDPQTAGTMPPELLGDMVVGRGVGA
jgi:uncharacterized peroxidase-related enzyme